MRLSLELVIGLLVKRVDTTKDFVLFGLTHLSTNAVVTNKKFLRLDVGHQLMSW